ncbi:hypothetical protein E2562_019498 [Oryza meyeriana var. granulata]|uniref:DUF1618 domain-containing protein n=1 Tax=Oryza meyeriana var. granulata TaxID=110450 RepID=A0A6G1DKD4_9ORYZ|nr:hypothetical protein E2562_019498 [Oryza meyeriana var. granulata]
MAKRRRSDDRKEKRTRRRRLYLLTHDWDRGFSMYKLDVDDFDPTTPTARTWIPGLVTFPTGRSSAWPAARRRRAFSFDGERGAWARHGRWHLPFLGKAFFVHKLDAWIGLSSQRRGHIAACRVVSRRDDPGCAEPACKTGNDLLFIRDGMRHLDYNLTYMGNANFCIQETLTCKGDDFVTTFGLKMLMLLRLVTFRVEYSADGELRAVNRREKIFKLSRITATHPPSAFWI